MHFIIKLNYESFLFFPDYTKLVAVPILFLLRYYSVSHYCIFNSWSLCFSAHSVFMAFSTYYDKKDAKKPVTKWYWTLICLCRMEYEIHTLRHSV